MTRTRIADVSTDGTAYGHLLPVLRAEQGWGNSTRDGFHHSPDGAWSAHMRRPLHIEQLLAEFEFPAHITVTRRPNGSTFVMDHRAYVEIAAADLSRPFGPPRRARTGLLARVFGP